MEIKMHPSFKGAFYMQLINFFYSRKGGKYGFHNFN